MQDNPAVYFRTWGNDNVSYGPVELPGLVDWIRQGGRIGGVVLNEGAWFNIGSRGEYLQVHRIIGEGKWRPRYVASPAWPNRVDPDAVVDGSARLRGCTAVGKGCVVGEHVLLEDTILWPRSQIASQSELRDCIVRSGRKVNGIHSNLNI